MPSGFRCGKYMEKGIKLRIIRILTLLMFYFLPLSLKAGAADTISYSGRIVNSDGSPRTGVVELEISFHSEETGGTAKGTALDPFTVSLVNGFFNLELNLDFYIRTNAFG